MTKMEALSKCMKLCSTKEFARSEIIDKLNQWQIQSSDIDEIIDCLIEDKFLDESRMARFYANDKLRFNKWGVRKIKFMLQQKGVSSENIILAIDQFDPDEYSKILQEELEKKRKTIKGVDSYAIKAKLLQFAIGRGFEQDLSYSIVNKLTK